MSEQAIECGLVSADAKMIERFKAVCAEFSYSLQVWSSAEELIAVNPTCRMIACHIPFSGINEAEFAKKAVSELQSVLLVCSEARVMAIFDKLLSKEDTAVLKKADIHSILTVPEVYQTSKLEFITTQLVRAEYIPVKHIDLIPGSVLPFDLYHLMPLSGKFLRISRGGAPLEERKKEKMKDVGEFYVHRSQLPLFSEYMAENSQGQDGLIRQCRAQFLEFQAKYGELAMILSDQSESLSYEEGKALLGGCHALACRLAATLSQVGITGMWDVINNSSIGEFGSVERAPAVAAYAAFFAMAVGLEDIEELIFAALIMDLGVLFLDPPTTRRIREDKIHELKGDALTGYRRYPIKSIEAVLSRRLPLEESLKKMILLAHERADGKGFPKGVHGERFTLESQLLGFSSLFDRGTVLRMGKKRTEPASALAEMIREQMRSLKIFNMSFLGEMEKAFLKKPSKLKKAA